MQHANKCSLAGRRPYAEAVAFGLLVGLPLLGGCANRVTTYTPPLVATLTDLPRPTRVLVVPFSIDADAIREDRGIGARLQRKMSGDADQRRAALASDIRVAISDALLFDLAKTGLPAQLAPEDAQPLPGNLLVTGAVTRVDEGNRTRRLAVGFGAGKSTVAATVELSATGADGSRIVLQRYDGSSDSGHRPGLAAGGLGAAAQASAAMGAISTVSSVGGEVRRAPAAAEAERTAHKIAGEIGHFLAERGWMQAWTSTSR